MNNSLQEGRMGEKEGLRALRGRGAVGAGVDAGQRPWVGASCPDCGPLSRALIAELMCAVLHGWRLGKQRGLLSGVQGRHQSQVPGFRSAVVGAPQACQR